MIIYDKNKLIDTKQGIVFMFSFSPEPDTRQVLEVYKIDNPAFSTPFEIPACSVNINQKRRQFFELIAYKLSENEVIDFDEVIEEIFDDTGEEE